MGQLIKGSFVMIFCRNIELFLHHLEVALETHQVLKERLKELGVQVKANKLYSYSQNTKSAYTRDGTWSLDDESPNTNAVYQKFANALERLGFKWTKK